jgi:uncharacterized membrane protein YkvA (DUF1232 family)
MSSIRQLIRLFKRELAIYRGVLADPRTPVLGKILLGAAIAYVVMPFDLIPDWIPVLGQLDDLVIVPALVGLALWVIPRGIVQEHRERVAAAG